jgi:flagellar biosynthesis protein FliR
MPHSRRLTRRFFSVLISLIVAFAIPRPVPAFDGGLTLCQIVESLLGAKSGATKKAAALSFVTSALSATDLVTGKNIVDPNQFQDGLGKVIDGVVGCLNASVWANKQQS